MSDAPNNAHRWLTSPPMPRPLPSGGIRILQLSLPRAKESGCHEVIGKEGTARGTSETPRAGSLQGGTSFRSTGLEPRSLSLHVGTEQRRNL